MKHIEKYNNFIKLNEDIKIDGDIDDYDLDIIKDGLIELEDLGWKITSINKIMLNYHIKLELITRRITHRVSLGYDFNKEKYITRQEEVYGLYSDNSVTPHVPTEYERIIINCVKNCSMVLLNMLDLDKGNVSISNYGDNYNERKNVISINLNKVYQSIKLNEDTEILGDIDEYDTNLIKDGLIELVDLGCEIIEIVKFTNKIIRIKLKNYNSRISGGILVEYKFNKNRFYFKSEKIFVDLSNGRQDYIKYIPNEYNQLFINTIKERSQIILNMINYHKGLIKIESYDEIRFGTIIEIYLYE